MGSRESGEQISEGIVCDFEEGIRDPHRQRDAEAISESPSIFDGGDQWLVVDSHRDRPALSDQFVEPLAAHAASFPFGSTKRPEYPQQICCLLRGAGMASRVDVGDLRFDVSDCLD